MKRRWTALMLSFSMIAGMLAAPAEMVNAAYGQGSMAQEQLADSGKEREGEPGYIFKGNMVRNPGFEVVEKDETTEKDKLSEWSVSGGAGPATNNQHRGKKHFYLDPDGQISQEVKVPYMGYYKAGLWVAASGSGGKLLLTNKRTEQKVEKEIPGKNAYNLYEAEIWLDKGDTVEIRVVGSSSWLNGDDCFLEYNKNRFENIVASPEFDKAGSSAWEKLGGAKIESGKAELVSADDGIKQELYIPQDGPYYAEVTLEKAENAEVSFAGQKSGPAAGDKTVRVKADGLEEGTKQELLIKGKATVTKAEVKFNLAEFPNTAPEASDIRIIGQTGMELVLYATYQFSDADKNSEGESKYQWLMSDEENGNYEEIEGETGRSRVLKKEYENKFLKFRVTPVDQYAKAGEPVVSGPVNRADFNLILNPSFENGTIGWQGISIATNGDGTKCGTILKGRKITQSITVPKTAYYDLTGYIYGAALDEEWNGTIGIEDEAGNVLASAKATEVENSWNKLMAEKILLESGQEIKIVLKDVSDRKCFVDNCSLECNRTAQVPALNNVKSIQTSPTAFDAVVDRTNKTVQLNYFYGTDLSKVKVEDIVVSQGASASMKKGDVLDLSGGKEVSLSVTGSDQKKADWKVIGKLKEKKVVMTSSNKELESTFNWAANKMDQYVMTDKTGPVNVSENNQVGTGDKKYIPSYWAGYYDRTAFYTRDFVHQATGAQIAGLSNENYSMFEAFAKECTEERKWYTVWALNFDGSVYALDYNNENSFVREVPAQFELVEKAYKQYLWSGDKRYIENEDLWNFYTNVMTKYVDSHDENKNGVAQEVGTGIFNGSCTYNERGRRVIEAGDAIGSQYQATLAYAGMLKARGQEEESQKWYKKAADLKKYFNEEWSVADNAESSYVSAWGPNGERYSDFSKETSWFIPLKMISDPGQRNNDYINFILENLGNGIGTAPTAPANIEAYTYIPDMLFLYNRNDDAWKWMKYIASIKDQPHERPTQGTNGDYPEISFTYVSHAIEGMMGVEPNAGENRVATSPRLPSEVDDMAVQYMQIGDYELDLAHNGNTSSTLTNHGKKDIIWEARFYGDYEQLKAGYQVLKAEKKEINGETVSYVSVTVPAGGRMNVSTDTAIGSDENAAKNVDELIGKIGTVTLNSKAAIDAARKAYNALSDNAKVLVCKLSVLEAAEARYQQLLAASSAQINISKVKIGTIPSQAYNGKSLTPKLSISYNATKLVKGKDYTVSYSQNKNIGTAKVKVTGAGKYTGSVTKTFQIIVKKNAVYTVGNYKYKITNAKTNGTGTVTLTGVKSKSTAKKLKKITVGKTATIGGKKFKVTEIGSNAFSGCGKVTSVSVGVNVGKISTKAFYNCKKLQKITISSTVLKSVGKNALKNISAKAKIKVPKKKLKAYKKLFKSKGQKKTVKITV